MISNLSVIIQSSWRTCENEIDQKYAVYSRALCGSLVEPESLFKFLVGLNLHGLFRVLNGSSRSLSPFRVPARASRDPIDPPDLRVTRSGLCRLCATECRSQDLVSQCGDLHSVGTSTFSRTLNGMSSLFRTGENVLNGLSTWYVLYIPPVP